MERADLYLLLGRYISLKFENCVLLICKGTFYTQSKMVLFARIVKGFIFTLLTIFIKSST